MVTNIQDRAWNFHGITVESWGNGITDSISFSLDTGFKLTTMLNAPEELQLCPWGGQIWGGTSTKYSARDYSPKIVICFRGTNPCSLRINCNFRLATVARIVCYRDLWVCRTKEKRGIISTDTVFHSVSWYDRRRSKGSLNTPLGASRFSPSKH